MDKDISASILKNVLQCGHLDFEKTTQTIVNVSKSKTGHFFEAVYEASLHFTCRYSTSDQYIMNERYTFEDLPENQYAIYHKNNIIAIISIDNQKELENLPDNIRQRLHDSIAIGIVLGNLKISKFSFTMSICTALGRIVTQIIEELGTRNVNEQDKVLDNVNNHLQEVIGILYDTIDYLNIDSEKIVLTNDIVDIKEFLEETMNIARGLFKGVIKEEIDDNVPKKLIFDKTRVQQMLLSVLRKLEEFENIRVHISWADYSSSETYDVFILFRIFSDTSRKNVEIQKRFQIDVVSVSSLDVFVVKRLCEIMDGNLELSETNGVIMRIKTDVPGRNEMFRDKHVLLAIDEAEVSNSLDKILSEMGMLVTIFNAKTSGTLQQYSMLVTNNKHLDLADSARKRYIPVVGVTQQNEYLANLNLFNVRLTLPVTVQEVYIKCSSLLI